MERTNHLPHAKIRRSRTSWLLWLLPAGAAGLCVWFLYRDFVATGPAITLFFLDAEGLEEGNTKIQYRGAPVGVVKSLALSKDHRYVQARARLIASARDLARAGSIFWIVRPEVKLGGITGLRTIISGEFVTVQPGDGPCTNRFFAADKAPSPQWTNALQFVLLSPTLSSMREKSPVIYRGIQVGEVRHLQLGENADHVLMRLEIREEYAPLVRQNSRFWNAGGISFKLGLFRGAELSAESPETLLSGGVEFASPNEPGLAATNGAVFRLYDKPENAWKDWHPSIPLHLPQQVPATLTSPDARELESVMKPVNR